MPATPPVPSAIHAGPEPDRTESYTHDVQLNPYEIPFDKLVISVGAYAQSESPVSRLPSLSADVVLSVWHPRCQGSCAVPEGLAGRAADTDPDH